VVQKKKDEKKKRLHRPALIARLPKLWWRPGKDWPFLPDEGDRASYAALADDLDFWDANIKQRFRDLDHEAQRLQNRFWRLQLTLILGSATATILGAVQAATGGGHVGLAIASAVISGLLAGVTVLVGDGRAQQRYLGARLKAERIKSEYFLFLAGAGEYASDATRRHDLESQVDKIEASEGVT